MLFLTMLPPKKSGRLVQVANAANFGTNPDIGCICWFPWSQQENLIYCHNLLHPFRHIIQSYVII